MASDDERWKNARASADEALEREELLRVQLRASLELAESLIAERRAARAFDAPGSSARALRGERQEEDALEQRVRELQLIVQHVEARALSAEQDLSDVASAYVASTQLHIELEPRVVLTQIKELMGQLVGAECFVVYLLDTVTQRARPVGFEGITQSALAPVQSGVGAVGEAMLGGALFVSEAEPLSHGTLEAPLAVIPLLVSGQAIGAVSVLRLLSQKTSWSPVDHELFRLLSLHAGVALLSAHLYQQKSDFLSALAGLGESLG